MKNFERELIAIEKLEDVHEEFIQQLGKAALEVLKKYDGDVEDLEKPEALAPEDVNEESLMERDVELDDWKYTINKILALTNQRVVEAIDEIEPFEAGTF